MEELPGTEKNRANSFLRWRLNKSGHIFLVQNRVDSSPAESLLVFVMRPTQIRMEELPGTEKNRANSFLRCRLNRSEHIFLVQNRADSSPVFSFCHAIVVFLFSPLFYSKQHHQTPFAITHSQIRKKIFFQLIYNFRANSCSILRDCAPTVFFHTGVNRECFHTKQTNE